MRTEQPTLHILRVPTRVYSQQASGEPRWCFVCRKVVPFTLTITVPVDPMSYYGPTPTVACEHGHGDGDLFPGRFREWDE